MLILYILAFAVNSACALHYQSPTRKNRNLFFNGFMGYNGERSKYDVRIKLDHLLQSRIDPTKIGHQRHLPKEP